MIIVNSIHCMCSGIWMTLKYVLCTHAINRFVENVVSALWWYVIHSDVVFLLVYSIQDSLTVDDFPSLNKNLIYMNYYFQLLNYQNRLENTPLLLKMCNKRFLHHFGVCLCVRKKVSQLIQLNSFRLLRHLEFDIDNIFQSMQDLYGM